MTQPMYLLHLLTALQLMAALFLLFSPVVFSLLFTARYLQVKNHA